ncbi:hypothetical protein BH10BAC2_BH10BAC2_02780 [soil metagenome]
MANVPVTISLVNGTPTATPDTAWVSSNDVIIWSLASGLRWPQANSSNISRATAAGSSNLLSAINYVPSGIPGVPGTIQGTVISNATPTAFENYNATVSQASDVGFEDLILNTHTITFDPKIQVKS